MIPLPILQLFLYIFLYDFLPIFLYDFIGISLETVGGMGYGMGYGICRWCNGLVVVDSAAVTLVTNIIYFYEIGLVGNGTPTDHTEGKSRNSCL